MGTARGIPYGSCESIEMKESGVEKETKREKALKKLCMGPKK